MQIHTIDLLFQNIPNTIACFAIDSTAGLILVESGPHSTLPQLRSSLGSLGYQLADVRHVLLTHIHLDHAGAAWALAQQGARVYVHPAGRRHLLHPERLMASARQIYKDQMDGLWGEMRPIAGQQLEAIPHGARVAIGEHSFRAWHTPGHASHHIAWQLGDVLFSGDVGGIRIGSGPVMPPCPPPDIHIEHWMASISLIKSLNRSNLYLTHFGHVRSVAPHLEALKTTLNEWSEWMRPFYERGKTEKEIVPAFKKHVNDQLMAAGLNELQSKQYEAANPAWMSVYGLMRYWRKRRG